MAIGELVEAAIFALSEAATAAQRAWDKRRQEQAAALLAEAAKLEQQVDEEVDARRDPGSAAPDAPAPAGHSPDRPAGAAESSASENSGPPKPQ